MKDKFFKNIFQCSHQEFALASPRAPSSEKQGPCKNIRGPEPALQIVCYMKYLPDPIWRKRCLRFGGGVYDVVGRAWDQRK